MKIIVGLGNPDSKYKYTRHNIGFIYLNVLADYFNVNFSFEKKFSSELIKFKLKNEDILLLKPLTYMNNSGIAIRKIIDYYKIEDLQNLIVITDDVNLPFSKIRIRKQGGAGGHNGLKSIIQHLTGRKDFIRIRFGIDAPPPKFPLDRYVLSEFKNSELKEIKDLEGKVIAIIETIILYNVDKAMNEFN